MNLQDKTATSHLARSIAMSLRPRMIILSWAVYTCVVMAHNVHDVPSVVLGLILFVAMYGIVALQNDFSDVETDKINRRKDVPYAMGHLTQKQLLITVVTLSIITTIAGYILNYSVLLWVSLYIALGYAYSGPLKIKSRGILAALLLGFCYGAMPWLIGASATNQLDHYNLLFLAFASFVFSSGIIVIKDFKDIKGDRATGKKTLLVSKGPSFTRNYYLSVTSLSYILLVIFSYIFTMNVSFVFMTIALGLFNYWLLMPQSLLSKATSRSMRGKWSRVIFFSYAVLLYLISVSAT